MNTNPRAECLDKNSLGASPSLVPLSSPTPHHRRSASISRTKGLPSAGIWTAGLGLLEIICYQKEEGKKPSVGEL